MSCQVRGGWQKALLASLASSGHGECRWSGDAAAAWGGAACPAVRAVAVVSYRGLGDGQKRKTPSFAGLPPRTSARISS